MCPPGTTTESDPGMDVVAESSFPVVPVAVGAGILLLILAS